MPNSIKSTKAKTGEDNRHIILMKKSLLTILIIVLLLPFKMSAQNERQYINYFYVKGEVCLPIKVKHSGGEFFVYKNGERHDGALSYVEAWDCKGRHIISPVLGNDGYSTDKSKPVVRKYTFEYLYPDESQSSESEAYYPDESVYENSSRDSHRSSDIIGSIERSRRIPDPAYPNFTVQAGLSRVHGEFIRGKVCLGGRAGYVLYGGVGHDWLFKPKNEDFIGSDAKKLAWHVGMGLYGGDLNGETATGEFALLLDYASTPMIKNGSLNLWLEGTWYFGANGHFGAFGGLGVSGGNLNNDHLKWNFIFEIGLAYRFY